MNKIKYGFSKETLSQLALLIGKKLQLIYVDRFIREYQTSFVEASFLILNCGQGSKIKIDTEWFECDTTLESFYRIHTCKVEYDIDQRTSIYSFVNTSIISKVFVVGKNIQIDDQKVEHSLGFVIEREDGKRVLIVGGESALQNLVLVDDDKYISEILKDTVLTEVN